MGKGDKRSKKGKINIGSYGVSRPTPAAVAKKKATAVPAEAKPKKVKASAEKPAKPAAKKTTKKKSEE